MAYRRTSARGLVPGQTLVTVSGASPLNPGEKGRLETLHEGGLATIRSARNLGLYLAPLAFVKRSRRPFTMPSASRKAPA